MSKYFEACLSFLENPKKFSAENPPKDNSPLSNCPADNPPSSNSLAENYPAEKYLMENFPSCTPRYIFLIFT